MNFDKYVNKLPYPESRDYAKYNIYFSGSPAIFGTYRGLTKEEKDKVKRENPDALVEMDTVNSKALNEDRNIYYAEDFRLRELFWSDFAEEVGVSQDHPKFGILQRLAWDYGHSAGYSEVYNYAVDLALFLR